MKKYFSLLFVAFIAASFMSCAKQNKGKLSVTDEEKAAGWAALTEIGFKLKRPAFLDKYEKNILTQVVGDDEDDTMPIYKAYMYAFKPDYVSALIDEIMDSTELSDEEKHDRIDSEVRPNIVRIYGIYTLRAPLIGDESKIADITQFPNNKIVRKTDKYVYVLAFNNAGEDLTFDEENLSLYKLMLTEAMAIESTITTADPVPAKILLSSIKEYKFKTVDFDGNEVTEEIFKNCDVTLLNIWATWCQPCKAELPSLGNIHRKYSEQNCQVITICSDVTDKDTSVLELAKDIIKDSDCSFVCLRKNSSFNKIFSNLQGYPTSIFFDKNGNVIGEVIVGGRSEAQFESAFDATIAGLNK